MKRCLALIFFTFIVTLAGCGKNNNIDTSVGEKVFNDFSVKDFNGNTVNNNVISEKKITMINIWGTFCSPCIEEMPALSEMSEQYKEQGFQVIGIPVDIADVNGKLKDSQMETARMIISKENVKYCNIIPDKALYEALLKEVQSVPQTIFVNSEGKQIGPVYFGAKTDEEWAEIIEILLK